MLVFYGWTDTLLLNLVNTKESFFPKEDADLIVLDLPRVSHKLVRAIEKSGLFRQVIWLERPPFHKEKGPLTTMEKVKKLLSGEKYYRYYCHQLEKNCKNTSYRVLFTGAFWSETLFLYRYFRKKNLNLEISMVEEGTANYNSPPGWQFQCMPTQRFRERLMRLFYFPFTWQRARKHVRRTYLYSLDLRRSEQWLLATKLPEIGPNTPVCEMILKTTIENEDLSAYRDKPVYYFANPLVSGYEDNFAQTNELLHKIVECFPEGWLLFKPHPQTLAEGEDNWEQWIKEMYVEHRQINMDGVMSALELDKKLLISRNSSAPLTARIKFGKEPSILFTYRLYDCYRQKGEHITDEMVEDLKTFYPPEKLAVPDDMEKLQELIRRWVDTGSFAC